ncbi:MAG: hypothetical protein JNL42_03705 [Anaerolineae bacterium]|nr:hypothetical protein [Anaerolineae bacterium]
MTRERRLDLAAQAVLFLAGLLARLVPLLAHPFDGLYGQDAYTYHAMARALLFGAPYDGVYIWGVGYPALIGALTLPAFLPSAAQAVTLLFGAALSPLMFTLARLTGLPPAPAFVAGLLIAVCGQAVQSSVVVMSDIPALTWAIASAAALLTYRRDRRMVWAAASAALLTLATITRWNYGALAPLWIAALLALRLPPRHAAAAAAGLFFFLPQAIFAALRPSPTFFNYGTWDLARAVQSAFTSADGSQTFQQVNALFYARPLYDVFWIHGGFGVLAALGLVALIRSRKKVELLVFAGWFIICYGFLCGIPQQNPRYALILTPPVFIAAAYGFHWTWSRLRWRGARYGLAGAALLAIGLSLTAAWDGTDAFIARQDVDKAIVRDVMDLLPTDALVYTFELTPALRTYAPFTVRELYYETPESISEIATSQPLFLLVDVHKLHTQWAGMPLERTFDAMIAAQQMRPVRRFGVFTLYRGGVG